MLHFQSFFSNWCFFQIKWKWLTLKTWITIDGCLYFPVVKTEHKNENFEKMMLRRESWSEFRRNRSPALALLETVQEIPNATERNKYTGGVFIDLRIKYLTPSGVQF